MWTYRLKVEDLSTRLRETLPERNAGNQTHDVSQRSVGQDSRSRAVERNIQVLQAARRRDGNPG